MYRALPLVIPWMFLVILAVAGQVDFWVPLGTGIAIVLWGMAPSRRSRSQ